MKLFVTLLSKFRQVHDLYMHDMIENIILFLVTLQCTCSIVEYKNVQTWWCSTRIWEEFTYASFEGAKQISDLASVCSLLLLGKKKFL